MTDSTLRKSKIRNLKKSDDGSWMWVVQLDKNYFDYDENYAPDEYPNSKTYYTNKDGEGLWEEGHRGEMVQIKGTCQFSLRNCNSYGSAYNAIRRYFAKLDVEGTEPAYPFCSMYYVEKMMGRNFKFR